MVTIQKLICKLIGHHAVFPLPEQPWHYGFIGHWVYCKRCGMAGLRGYTFPFVVMWHVEGTSFDAIVAEFAEIDRERGFV